MTLDRDVRNAIVVPGIEGGASVGAERLALYNSDGTPLDLSIGVPGPPGTPGSDMERSTAVITMTGLDPLAESAGSFDLASIFRIFRIVTTKAARVRLYVSEASRDADAARPLGTDPTGDHGCIFEFVTTDSDLDWSLSPLVDAYTLDDSDDIYYTIQNLGATEDLTVTLYVMS